MPFLVLITTIRNVVFKALVKLLLIFKPYMIVRY